MNIDVDTTGLVELLDALLNGLKDFHISQVNGDYLTGLLSIVAPIWNPIWTVLSGLLTKYFGF
ncbi:MAG: hypothetical protein K6B52_02710 [Clostridiales bacterium]|nr:hypothetical protein [Clostridiales bacterium]